MRGARSLSQVPAPVRLAPRGAPASVRSPASLSSLPSLPPYPVGSAVGLGSSRCAFWGQTLRFYTGPRRALAAPLWASEARLALSSPVRRSFTPAPLLGSGERERAGARDARVPDPGRGLARSGSRPSDLTAPPVIALPLSVSTARPPAEGRGFLPSGCIRASAARPRSENKCLGTGPSRPASRPRGVRSRAHGALPPPRRLPGASDPF